MRRPVVAFHMRQLEAAVAATKATTGRRTPKLAHSRLHKYYSSASLGLVR
ncbi:MAG TPA: hypothetical protein VN643_00505 [Pyrinomonadaceae bacterium]|nr:hypothetical protein [Pyrinomonadaceae bacterium]